MILDRITDWIVTAWELIGLLFLSGSADPVLLRRWGTRGDDEHGDDSGRHSAAFAGRLAHRPHFF